MDFGSEIIAPDIIINWEDIAPEILLPSQMDDGVRFTPEQKMCDQLVRDALGELRHTFRKNNRRNKLQIREDTLKWVNGAKDCHLPFELAMDVLGKDMNAATKAVKLLCSIWASNGGTKPDVGRAPMIHNQPTHRVPEPRKHVKKIRLKKTTITGKEFLGVN